LAYSNKRGCRILDVLVEPPMAGFLCEEITIDYSPSIELPMNLEAIFEKNYCLSEIRSSFTFLSQR
jgi:hypothetical protein